jgi:GNAT superfamily N-acetyltransferase
MARPLLQWATERKPRGHPANVLLFVADPYKDKNVFLCVSQSSTSIGTTEHVMAVERFVIQQVVPDREQPAIPDGLEIRWHRSSDLETLCRAHLRRDYLNMRLAAGARIAVALLDGRPVCWGFYQTERCEQQNWLTLAMAPDLACIFAVYTDPEHRGKRIPSMLHSFAARHLADQGIRRFVWMISTDNTPSLRIAVNMDALDLLRVSVLRLGKLTFIKIGNGWPVGRWGRSGRYVLKIE